VLGDGKSTPGPERSLAGIQRPWLQSSLDVNVVGAVMVAQAMAPFMRVRRGGGSSGGGSGSAGGNGVERAPSVIVNFSARVGSISDNRLGGWYSYR
jgi:NAD(P)-dependent dehydrogenase (short-subunit alcohol dehydrogenase family)